MMVIATLAWLVFVVWLSSSHLCDDNLYNLFELLLVRGLSCDDARDVDNKERIRLNDDYKNGCFEEGNRGCRRSDCLVVMGWG